MVIIQMDRSNAPYHGIVVIACIAVVCLVLRLATSIGRLLNPTALNVINRLFGLVLDEITVEIMANGLKQLFPALASA